MKKNPKLSLIPADGSDEKKKIMQFLQREDITEFLSESNTYDSSVLTRIEFLISQEEKPIGFARIDAIRWNNRKASLTIYILPENRGKGVGRQSLSLLLDFCFNKLKFHRLEGEVYAYNLSSVKLMELSGFRLEGRLRQAKYHGGGFHDILVYGLLAEEYFHSR